MKKIILISACVVSTFASAQTKKITNPTFTPNESYSSRSENEVTGKIGFVAGAVNFGIDYNRMSGGSGFGGYFFFQTDKKSNNQTLVNQIISFGGTYKVVVAETKTATAYVATGLGIHMAKESGKPDANGKNSDETLIGPIMKIGAQYKITPQFSIGIERHSLYNWFNDSVAISEAAYYGVAGTVTF
jgi:hypothetical protein